MPPKSAYYKINNIEPHEYFSDGEKYELKLREVKAEEKKAESLEKIEGLLEKFIDFFSEYIKEKNN